MAFSNIFDTATPQGSSDPKEGDDEIRRVKSSIQERLAVDHVFALTGTQVSGADSGKHNKVTLPKQASAPTPVADFGHLYAMVVEGVTELFWVGGTGTPKQLTSGGKINNAATDLALAVLLAGDQTIAGLKTFSDLATFSTIPALPASDPTTDSQATRKKYVDDKIAAFLQTISINSVEGTSDIQTGSTDYADMADMVYTDTFVATNIFVHFDASFGKDTTSGGGYFQITIDNVSKRVGWFSSHGSSLDNCNSVISWAGAVTAASHTIKVQWKALSGKTFYQLGSTNGSRLLIVQRGFS